MPKLKRKSTGQRNREEKQRQRKRRADPDHLQNDNESKRRKRSDSVERNREKEANAAEKKTRRRRKNDTYRMRENLTKSQARKNCAQSWEENKRQFLIRIRQGPSSTCSCCGGLWFPTSLRSVSTQGLDLTFSEGQSIINVGNAENHALCYTCHQNIKQKKIPRLCLSNGLEFPAIPPVLQDLTTLEERLCAPMLPFLQIRCLGIDRQCGLRGNVVHIPNDIDCSVGILPRNLKDTQTIPLQLCRRIEYDRNYLYQLVRPTKVIEATKYLLGTELYRIKKITMSEDWMNSVDTQMEEFFLDFMNMAGLQEEDGNDEEILNPGDQETMIYSDHSKILRIAPGQGKKPVSLIDDLQGEEASYPSIYCGVVRRPKIKLSYSEIAKSEMRRYDRRCAKPQKLLHSFKLLQNHQVYNAVSTCLRKRKGCTATVDDFLNDNYVQQIIQDDLGYQMLKQVRTSPAFWEQKQKHILAMIRQLGIPTLFLTLSAAESQWPELLCTLSKVLDQEEMSEEQAVDLPYEKKASLIRGDPVTCARYFDHRLRQCFNFLLQPVNGVFNGHTLKDYYCRIEFQHRGSPHAHMLIWLEDAPSYDPNNEDSIQSCIDFVNSLITTESGLEGVIHQEHRKHTSTCKRKTASGTVCRFGIPFPPLKETLILQPFPTSFDPAIKGRKKEAMSKVKQSLEENRRNEYRDISSIDELLTAHNITYEDYITLIRSTIKRPSVFLKRNLNSCFTNPYMLELARLWRSNMDVQLILEPYGCAKYVCSYISKASGGVSKMLRLAAEECKKSKLPALQKLRKIGNTFLNQSEISAQEAAYGVLGMPLTKSSRDIIYIPTSPPDERISFIKSRLELQKLDPNSNEIFVEGLLDHYINRPDSLSDMCLAEFASSFTFTTKGGKTHTEEYVEEQTEDNEAEDETLVKLKGNKGFMKRRRVPRIIRFRKYGEVKDSSQFYREQIMLYLPWRNEDTEVTSIQHENHYKQHINEILDNSSRFNRMAPLDLQRNCDSDEENLSCNRIDEEFEVFCNDEIEADLFIELRNTNKDSPASERISNPEFIDEMDFQKLLESLNERQTQYLHHALQSVRDSAAFTEFVYGGAGVGKSTLIKCIVQSILRMCGDVGEELSLPKTVLAAPTGKAAFNIGGGTLHHTFLLPLTQYSGVLPSLPDDICNSLASQLRNLKLIIIDEVSMVSCEQLYQINSRLQQIFKTVEKFGGKSILLLGDLRQLRPVCAKYVFEMFNGAIAGISGNPLWEEMDSYELTEVMRQKDDKEFAEALNRLSKGELTSDDVSFFKSREINVAGSPPENTIWLFKTNKQVEHKNSEKLNSLQTDKATAKAYDQCQGRGSSKCSKEILKSAKQLTLQQTMGLPIELDLVVSARYMVTLNVDVSDGLANGSSGILQDISYGYTKGGLKVPKIAWLNFGDRSIGARRIRTMRAHGVSGEEGLVPISLEKRIIKNWPGRDVSVVRTQFPLRVAEALTVNKSQGDTYDSVVVDVNGLCRKGIYVAFSRARSSSGLFIVGTFVPPKCSHDDVVEKEIRRLKDNELTLLEDGPLHKIRSFFKCAAKNRRPENTDARHQGRKHTEPNRAEANQEFPSNSEEAGYGPRYRSPRTFPIIVNGINVYRDDFNSLGPDTYLLDNVIDAFLELVKNMVGPFNRTMSALRTQTVQYLRSGLTPEDWRRFVNNGWQRETGADIILLPRCLGQHWTLFVANKVDRVISMLDSVNHFGNLEDAEKICRFLDDVDESNLRPVGQNWNVRKQYTPNHSVQRNGTECGVYLCLFAMCVRKECAFTIPEEHVSRYRHSVRESIISGRIDFDLPEY